MITEITRLEELISHNDLESYIVYFGDPVSCIPCRRFKPHYDAASERSSVKFLYVNIRTAEDLIRELYGVSSVPAVFYVDTFSGTKDRLNSTVGALGLVSQIIDKENARLDAKALREEAEDENADVSPVRIV